MSGAGDEGITRKLKGPTLHAKSSKTATPARTGKGNNAPPGGAMRAMTGRGPMGSAATNSGSKKGMSYKAGC